MSSEKRTAANRANAAKSTGPRTPEGKQKSSLNAVKHGLTAQSSVLPGEDRTALEALSSSLMKQLKPRGVVQRLMAERIVSLTWKLRRVARAEEAVGQAMEEDAMAHWKHERNVNLEMNRYIFAPRSRPRRRDAGLLLASVWDGTREHPKDERLLRLTEYELKLDAALRAAMRELLELQQEAGAFEEVEEEPEPDVRQNEPTMGQDGAEKGEAGNEQDDPGLRCAAPAACGEEVDRANESSEAPVEKTNPTDGAEESMQVEAAPTVTPDSPTDSSAPAPGTSASPPPAPRR